MLNKKTLATAALAGLLSAGFATATFAADAAVDKTTTKEAVKDKHACKGLNSCKGNGADGKNECKGKGSCATDGSKK